MNTPNTVSQKTAIYASYRAQADAKNAAIGGDPITQSLRYNEERKFWLLPKLVDYLHSVRMLEDGGVVKIERTSSGNGYFATFFKSADHYRNYVEPMSMHAYFEH